MKRVALYLGFIFIFLITESIFAWKTETVMMPMRDSTLLATDIYRPNLGEGPWPVILIRTPYGKDLNLDNEIMAIFGLLIDLWGYACVVQDTRGRYDSEGVDSLYFHDAWGEKQDGYDTVEWLAAQSWCNGKIGSVGASATGLTQYFMAGAAPPHLTCCVVAVAAGNLYEDALFYHGVYREAMVDGWLEANRAEKFIDLFIKNPFYSPFYDQVNLATRYDSVKVPILHVGGWHDIFIEGQINVFKGLHESGGDGARGNQKIIIGPWPHDITAGKCGQLEFPESDVLQYLTTLIGWFEYYLKGNGDHPLQNDPAIQYYLMGDADQKDGPGNRWISCDSWPPEYTEVPLYFNQDGELSFEISGEGTDTYLYDPENPVPTLGGRNLNLKAGSYDQSSLEIRDDVLVYTSDVLEDTITVTGPVKVILYASTDVVDTDFTAKLCDVYPDGRSMLVADGIVRARHRNSITGENFITPGEVFKYEIDLWTTAIAFAPGHAIRISISSSNSPRFHINTNTGEPFKKETYTLTANQTIHFGEIYPSALILPVVEGIPNTSITNRTIPQSISLISNYPNPFNGETTIQIQPPHHTKKMDVIITDILGRQIHTWSLNSTTGENISLYWDARTMSGNSLPSGVYMIHASSGAWKDSHKMILMQ